MATPRLSTNLSDEDPESTGQEVAWTAAVPLRGRATVAGTPGTGGRLLSTVLNGLKKYTTLLVLLILMALFSFVSPYFLTSRNLINIVLQNTYFIIVAVGLSFVMIGGGIDLSVGYQMSLVGVVTAMMMVVYQLPVWLAVGIGLLLGTTLGLINGLIVAQIRTFPLIVTLATSTIFQGISYLISQAKTYRNYPAEFLFIVNGRVLGLPFDVFLALVIVICAHFIYSETRFGLRLIALGGNEEAARLVGLNTRFIKISAYTLCGFLVAIATLVMLAKANTMNSSFGPGTEFVALTAAIVGGVSFVGGEGSIPALVAGVFVLAVLGNGMQLAGWGTYAQYIVRGIILLGAVVFDEYQKKTRRALR
jgi:ribose/xylose/arabinose/galactoside ABC-type transport system permease subunit